MCTGFFFYNSFNVSFPFRKPCLTINIFVLKNYDFFGGPICGLFKPFYPFLATFDLLLVSKKPGGADLPPQSKFARGGLWV